MVRRKQGLSINRHVARAEALDDDIDRLVGTSLDKGVELESIHVRGCVPSLRTSQTQLSKMLSKDGFQPNKTFHCGHGKETLEKGSNVRSDAPQSASLFAGLV